MTTTARKGECRVKVVEKPAPVVPEPRARRVVVNGREYAALDADALLDWTGEEPSSTGFFR